MAGRNLELRPREEGTRDKAKIPVVRFPLDKITEHFQENISAVRGQFAVAEELGIAEVHSELLPEDKVTQVERLLGEGAPGKYLAFVGDGINDAPVLARADLGAAMGGIGSDAAIEAADIVLMDDDPRKLSLAMRISRKTMRLVWENIVFALAVKAVCLVLGALGIANMWVAIFADVGVMVLCVLNAARALDTKHL